MVTIPTGSPGLPSRDDIRRFIRESGGRVGKREISRHFKLGPEHRAALRDLLRDLAGSGDIAPAGHRRFAPPNPSKRGRLPDAMVVRVTGTDQDGDPIARPVEWQGDGPPPVIYMTREAHGQPALAPGQRVLARLKPIGNDTYEGRTLKRLTDEPARILGVFRAPDRLVPTDRRAKAEWRIPPGETEGALDGEIVLAEPLPGAGYGLKPAAIVERLGSIGDARSVSLICIHTHEIPTIFSPEALAEARRARATPLGRRIDLRETPLITIDGEDARDFDDAVYAEPDGEGFRLLVAIADVAHYVRPESALDRDARLRGNSCYFPDRVVPMLPEDLSNGWCSLKPEEDRGCLFVELHIDAGGRKTQQKFGRGLMRSAARLTYTQVQDAFDNGESLGLDPGLLPTLYAAFRALLAARQKRGTLDLDLPERRVVLDDAGHVAAIAPRPRLDSHRLIEEFMVLANVAAAEELERLKHPCMYRVHAPPSEEKLANLRNFLGTLEISLKPGGEITPRDLDGVLQQVAGTDHAPMVNEVMLRSQSQAAYSPDNIGHFGLALPRYAHFTSPIRRYADLLVHRALIAGLKLGLGALSMGEAAEMEDIAEKISATERRAALAEREAIDRYLAAYMADKIGASFEARISGVTRFGLFVTVHGNGATGLIPLSALPDDYWIHDEATQSLTGRKTRLAFRLTQDVTVRLAEASPVTGGLIFAIFSAAGAAPGRPRHLRESADKPRQSKKRARKKILARRALTATLLLLATSVQALATTGAGFDRAMAARVFSAALAFAAPRTLDPVTAQLLSLWGLHGITALDPTLNADLHGARLQLSAESRVVFDRPVPAPDDAAGWGSAAADLESAAYAQSATLRAAGTQALIQTFFDEMFNHLDPYSRYDPPAPAEAERTKLSVDAGAGLGLVIRDHGVVVGDLVPDGPGQQAGVRVGDRILAIDGHQVRGRQLDRARARLAGLQGTPVALRVRGLDGLVRDLTLTLADIPPETVFSERDGNLLLIRILSFTSNTAERLSEAIEAGLAATPPPAAIAVDLRGNRGGLLRQAVTSVALLADHGIIASTAGRAPEATHDWRIDGGDLTHGLPVIILVDGRSASAAEIMAAALADLGRGVVIGSATLGKGLVQTITRLPDGGELYVTWSRVLAPRGWPIQSLGVLPQLCTSGGPQQTSEALAELLAGRQPMQAALEASRAARPPLPVARALDIRNACPAAEGRDSDLLAAHFLADHARAYRAALLGVAE